MIEYETLVRAIEDWRAGKRPGPLPVSPHAAGEDQYDEIELEDASGEVSAYDEDVGGDGVDDFAVFDPANDLHTYFAAELRIEQAWVDPQARYDLFSEYGIRDETHYHQVRASIERFLQSATAEARWGGAEAIERARVEVRQQLLTPSGDDFEPVEGVSVQHWAYAKAQIEVGYDPQAVLAQLNIGEELWARASEVWQERMSRDETGVIAQEYAGALEAAQEQLQAARGAEGDSEAPMAMERWVEVEQASVLLLAAGHTLDDVLAEFDLTPQAWEEATQWWTAYLEEYGEQNDRALALRYEQLRDFYRDHYAHALGEGE